ncbi:TPA: hypothetical protein DEO28_00845 [Candidatus Dependentiae bacterium]|nr:MAG: hypothetical protein UR14_C0003G0021 [candidate division TM6 bacterium GW2011_GWE2_31_21]KKP54141.1 MAG: hypothetical protein UR43_C0001G0159 [candidate division TM6 bacterium GW2011_GWF2_33_332]HBS47862.1 hypothetical protein [Candidatus Dependentiae bacterium]HBZ73047.1 hypothetical protein [Candidatus Dependentiae bacterium]
MIKNKKFLILMKLTLGISLIQATPPAYEALTENLPYSIYAKINFTKADGSIAEVGKYAFSARKQILICSSIKLGEENKIFIYNSDNFSAPLQTINTGQTTSDLQISPLGDKILQNNEFGDLKIWRFNAEQNQYTLCFNNENHCIFASTKDLNTIATAKISQNQTTLKIWLFNVHTSRYESHDTKTFDFIASSLAVSPNKSILISNTIKKEITILITRENSYTAQTINYHDWLLFGFVMTDSKIAALNGANNSIVIYNKNEETNIFEHFLTVELEAFQINLRQIPLPILSIENHDLIIKNGRTYLRYPGILEDLVDCY